MRTKTLLLMAAVVAAGITSVSAQVFSVNVVGYVTTTLQGNARYTLISNPLEAGTNSTIATLFADLPSGSTVFKWSGSQFTSYAKGVLGFLGAAQTDKLVPGEGAFVLTPAGSTNIPITFVGEVQQGLLTNAMPVGFSIISSRVPVAGTMTQLGYTNAVAGDTVFKWDATAQNYVSSTYNVILGGLNPDPTLGVGEAVFISKTTAGNWVRNFVVP